jgi:hypothetical protein
MTTETETFDELTITTYANHKIYIEMQRPIALSILRERLAELGGTHTDKRSGRADGDDSRIVHDATKVVRDSGSGLPDQLAHRH